MRLFCVGEKRVLTVRMHGWRSGVTRADASRQVFWVFREAGVKRIISEGGVGTVNKLLDLRDFIIPDDYLDLSVRKDVMLDGRYLLIMRDALCPEMREALIRATKKRFDGRVFTRGTYAVTDGRHFESPAEVAMMSGHADIVGQSIAPEVYLAREIGDSIHVRTLDKSQEQLFLLVAAGDELYAVVSDNTARSLAVRYADIDVSTAISFNQFQAWAMAKNDTVLLQRMNKWLHNVRQTDEYKQLRKRYNL